MPMIGTQKYISKISVDWNHSYLDIYDLNENIWVLWRKRRERTPILHWAWRERKHCNLQKHLSCSDKTKYTTAYEHFLSTYKNFYRTITDVTTSRQAAEFLVNVEKLTSGYWRPWPQHPIDDGCVSDDSLSQNHHVLGCEREYYGVWT